MQVPGGGPLSAPAVTLLVLFVDDLAALLHAIVLGRVDDSLALAGVLPGAAVARTGARALPLARVDAGAVHRVARLLPRRAGHHGAAQDEGGRRARDQHSLGPSHSSSLVMVRVALVRTAPQPRTGHHRGSDARHDPAVSTQPGPLIFHRPGGAQCGTALPQTRPLARPRPTTN